MRTGEEIKAFHARSEASVKQYLRSKSWPEKVRSIKRMNAADRIAKEAMRKALADEATRKSQH
jgi:hypothetical protein